ncbi:lytic transglycosylase domain-containing protein [Cochlodiniinecator piscidefendens]|uniref:lytic transglycosylase domain-containing protein n=1 Tax=Cochlodiniinecator piscidefendens TaxID=2715756 RepID=UPI00140DF291|nr:lytic transglycosylase domain-containing protein [Cochlodiniinecator piscidefendens]
MAWRIGCGVLFAFFLQVIPVLAQDPEPYPDFSFRRVPVPSASHSGPRITVQAGGESEALAESPASSSTGTHSDAGETQDWFWEVVSPDLSAQSPGRLSEAMSALTNAAQGRAPSAPRLQDIHAVAQSYGTDILIATVGTDVSPAFALAVIWVESAGRAEAISSAGAQGLMQLIPATAERFGVTDANDPAQNISGGVQYLDWLISQFDRDPVLVLAAYNAGENAVRSNNGVPPYAETRNYVPKVLAAWQVARGLCLTPPEFITDGCVFRRADG